MGLTIYDLKVNFARQNTPIKIMHEQLAKQLYDHGDLQHEPEYFGRGMNKSCHAVIGTQADFMDSIVSLVDDLIADAMACETEEQKVAFLSEVEELRLNSLSSIRTDNLGSEIIFY